MTALCATTVGAVWRPAPPFDDMWIKTENTDSAGEPVTRRLKHPAVDEVVEFSENGKAQVTSEVGETLIDQYDAIRPTEAESDADADSSGAVSVDDADESDGADDE